MAQMPEEGRKFGIVDSYWRDIMTESVSHRLRNHISLFSCQKQATNLIIHGILILIIYQI